jgi:hypothetical protein
MSIPLVGFISREPQALIYQEAVMGLNFNFTGIKNYKSVCHHPGKADGFGSVTFVFPGDKIKADGDYIVPTLNWAVWGTMLVGMDELTADNLDEFVARLNVMAGAQDGHIYQLGEKSHWYADTDEGKPCRRTFEKFIGLTTNASTMTRAQFLKKVSKVMDNRIKDAKRTASK